MSVAAIDIGFGFTKATTNGRDFLTFKSVLGQATDIHYREVLMDEGRPEEYLHIQLDDGTHFVGDLAERQSSERSFTLDQNQFMSDFVKVLSLTALAHLVERNVPVNLVTGLPISYYRRFKDEMVRLLQGRHEVSVFNQHGEKTDTVVSINQVRVIPQPYGSYFEAMLNDFGEITNARLARSKVGVVDVGFRTADYTIADRIRFSSRGSRTTDSGISRAFSVIAAKLQEMTGVNVELYRLYQAVHQGSIKIRGQSLDIRPLADHVLKQLATTVATEVNRQWADDWDIDTILITGGGGKVLSPYLKGQLHGEVLATDPNKDARVNNVYGYWKFGRHLWERGTATADTH
jgi:plasmid segregation protein ParM